jgi:hypothetical protein
MNYEPSEKMIINAPLQNINGLPKSNIWLNCKATYLDLDKGLWFFYDGSPCGIWGEEDPYEDEDDNIINDEIKVLSIKN